VIRGLRSKEIAEELGAAVKTVNIHRSRIMSKLGATTVVELVRLLEPRRER
jgi:DNA-binding CsgD family transcriptional regulator